MSRLSTFLFALMSLTSLLQAEEWSTTNIQLLYGNDFDRLVGEKQVLDGDMKTVTIEHAGGWEYGSNFFFIDMSSADYASGEKQTVYAEWAPKLSFSKLSSTDLSWGFIKDIYLAGELNRGNDFSANNIGLGVGLDLLGFDFIDLNLLSRNDNFNDATFQIVLAWKKQFDLASVPFVFEGFLDYYGTDYGTEVLTQPRLLIDGRVISEEMNKLQAGIELYYYKSSAAPWRGSIHETVPQFMIKWVW